MNPVSRSPIDMNRCFALIIFIYLFLHYFFYCHRRGHSVDLAAQPMNLSLIQVRKYFDRADKDKDGKLTKDEWFTVLNSSGVPTTR